MAKYNPNKPEKVQKQEKNVMPDMKGMAGKKDVFLLFNEATDRYDLKIASKLVLSSISQSDCLHRAVDKGVVWSD